MQLKTVIIVVLLTVGIGAVAADRHVRGIVRDSLTTEGLPYASVTVDGSATGTVTDSRGLFELVVPEGARTVTAATQGYAPRTVPLWQNSLNILDIYLPPQAQELREVVVHKKKYTKRNNPAVEFARRLRERADLTDPRRRPYYSYERYERITLGLNDFDTAAHRGFTRRFPFLAEHIDTSALTGKPVLTMSVNESSSTVYHRSDPATDREIVHGRRRRGVDEVLEAENVQTLLSEAFREVDLYDSDIRLLRNNFISPLSALAPDFYRFYLVDTVAVAGVPCVVLAFYPRNPASTGFIGHVYVERDDSAMAVRRVELRVSPDINLNFVDRLLIEQEYARGEGGERIKTLDRLVAEMRLMPGTPQIYAGRSISLRGHSFAAAPDSIYGGLATTREEEGYDSRDSLFWVSAASLPPSHAENSVALLMRRLRRVPLYYYGELLLQRMFTGYWPTGNPSCFDIGPLNTIASYNSVEGLRLRFGGMTTAALSPRWFGRAYGAYGFRDHRWKYGGELEYSFHDKRVHSREFPVHSLRLSHSYDMDRLGSHYLYTSQDNFVLSLTRMADHLQVYRRETRLKYTLELENNFSVEATAEHVRLEPGPYVGFTDASGNEWGHYGRCALEVQLRYAPGEKFIQERSNRIPANLDAPVMVLSHRFSPKGLFGNRFAVQVTEASFSKRFWLSIMGRLDVVAGAGHVWSAAPFPDLLIPNANISYTIQPGSFALMNPLEFVNTSYVSCDLTYRPQGLLLNLIPGVRRLGLREIVAFRALWGHLDRRCTPGEGPAQLFAFPAEAHVTEMKHGPYMEIAAGLDNILRCLRVDYVWRLSYRAVPYEIDRSGVRVALHLTF